jgi:subtilisin family serine protease
MYMQFALATVLFGARVAASGAEVDPVLLSIAARTGAVDTLIVLTDQDQPLLSPLMPEANHAVRRKALVDALMARADAAQASLRHWLELRGIAHRGFWISNAVAARLPAAALAELAPMRDVASFRNDKVIAAELPAGALTAAPEAVEWGVARVHAPEVWALGFTGQGVVIGSVDTGEQWDHPALKDHYRGWNGFSVDHNFNWHDAIHSGKGACGVDLIAPCDDSGHGTHTVGTFAGGDGGTNRIGVAPGAKWIGCRSRDAGGGTTSSYIECLQWMLAPTNLIGKKPSPDLAPDVVNNSWSCSLADGCTTGNEIKVAVDNLVAGGIVFVAGAGNGGPSCSTITDPPAIHDSAFDVGATDSSDVLAAFSSRGPVGGSGLIRPDISAPGVNIRSSYPTNAYASLSGTSMAAPHVAGAVALLLSAQPGLKGNPGQIARILRATAATAGVTDGLVQTCGGTPTTTWPNNMIGYGRLDVAAAVQEVVFVTGFEG